MIYVGGKSDDRSDHGEMRTSVLFSRIINEDNIFRLKNIVTRKHRLFTFSQGYLIKSTQNLAKIAFLQTHVFVR